jgi:hypothetical protein
MPMADSNRYWRSVVLVDSNPDGASLRPVHWYRVFAVASSAAEAGPGRERGPEGPPLQKAKRKSAAPRAAAGGQTLGPGVTLRAAGGGSPGPGLRGLRRPLASAWGRGPVEQIGGANLKRRRPAAHGRQAPRMGARGSRPRNPSHGPKIPRGSPIQDPDFAGKWGRNPRFPVGRERASGPRGRRAGDFGLCQWAKVRFPQPSLQVSLPDSGGASWQTPKWAPHSHFPLIPDLAGKLGGSLRFPIEPTRIELEGPIMIRPGLGAAMGVPGAAGGGFCPGSESAHRQKGFALEPGARGFFRL